VKSQNRRPALCKDETSALCRIATCQLQVTDGAAPEWVQLLPAGERIETQDSRVFSNPNPERIVANFNALGIDLPFDFEHGSEVAAPKGQEAPASGWIKQLENRGGSIWARVEWTERGRAAITSKEYRYVSPAVSYTKEGDLYVVTGISSAAITTHPAITTLKALSSKDTPGAHASANQEDITMLKRLAKMLGLKDDADEKDIETAAKKVIEDSEKLSKEHEKLAKEHASLKDKHEDVIKAKAAAEAQVATLSTQKPDPKAFVARAELDLALARVSTLETERATEKKDKLAKDIEAELAAATKAGKITPAQVEDARAMCSREGGLEDFRKLMSKAAVIAPDRIPALDGKPKGGESLDAITLSAADRKVMQETGVTEEEYKKGAVKLANLRAQRRSEENAE
jgi:phage I-like protein